MASDLKDRGCRYISDRDNGFTLRQLYDNTDVPFPIYLVVLEGFIGTCKYDDLSSDNVLRVCGRSRQRRIIGRVSGYYLDMSKFFSIPVNDELRFCVVSRSRKHTVVHQQQSLAVILEENTYPITVEYDPASGPRDNPMVQPGNKDKFKIAILGEYMEEFLLCNSIFEGFELNNQMFLSSGSTEVDCAKITGIEGVDDKTFRKLLKEHETVMASNRSILPEDAGNPEITKVTLEEGTGSGNPLPDFILPFLSVDNNVDPPSRPTKLNRPLPSVPETRSENSNDDVYEITDDDAYELPDNDFNSPNSYEVMSRESEIDTRKSVARRNSPSTIYYSTTEDPKHISVELKKKSLKDHSRDSNLSEYSKFPTSKMHSVQRQASQDQESKNGASSCSDSNLNDSRTSREHEMWLSNLSVSEVCGYLKELALKKHVSKFAKAKIDGNILREFTHGILEREFHFSRIDAIKLMKFVENGHIPKT